MKIVNLTPHDVTLISKGEKIVFKKEEALPLPRVNKKIIKEENIENITFVNYVIEEITDLPVKRPDTLYIVSAMVKNACTFRTDFIAPDTNRAIRDAKGRIIGVPAFIR